MAYTNFIIRKGAMAQLPHSLFRLYMILSQPQGRKPHPQLVKVGCVKQISSQMMNL